MRSTSIRSFKRWVLSYYQARPMSSQLSTNTRADILYLDKNYCIVNKPANVCIDGEDEITMEKVTTTTLDEMSHPYKQKIRHCHQLDKTTSGILIYGLNQNSTKRMNQVIQKRNITKTYHALVHGHIDNINHFVLDFPLSDQQEGRPSIGTDKQEGRPSITECWVLKYGYLQHFPVTLLKLKLHTGRKHQIRAHLSHIGYPILGDRVYSAHYEWFDRMYLDSHHVSFTVNVDHQRTQINVSTKSDQMFDELITATHSNVEYDPVFMMDHALYSYGMVIPFVMDKDMNHARVLVKQTTELDHVPRTKVLSDRMWWSFVCESKLGDGFCDMPQTMARNWLKQYPYFSRYLYGKSLFCPKELESTVCAVKMKGNENWKYWTHHMASNMRRNNAFHCTVLCAPHVVYFVPFKNAVLKDEKHMIDCAEDKMQWMTVSELMSDGSQSVDPLMENVLMNECVSSLSWLTGTSDNVLILE
eukprot:471856_1